MNLLNMMAKLVQTVLLNICKKLGFEYFSQISENQKAKYDGRTQANSTNRIN